MNFDFNRRTKDLKIIDDNVVIEINLHDSEKGVKTELVEAFSENLAEILLEHKSDTYFSNELANRMFLNLSPTNRIAELRELLRELNIDVEELKEDYKWTH